MRSSDWKPVLSVKPYRLTIAAASAVLVLAGCASLEPHYADPSPDLPPVWPGQQANSAPHGASSWDELVLDERLRQVIGLALENNDDLAISALRVERARQLYQIKQAGSLPDMSVEIAGSRTRTYGAAGSSLASTAVATVGFTSYELDLFGKVRSLKKAALESFLASQQTQRQVRNIIVGDTIKRYITLAADQELLGLAQSTLDTRVESLKVLSARLRAGEASPLDYRRAETELAQAHDDLLAARTQVELDRQALDLTVGSPVHDAQLPVQGHLADILSLAGVAVGLPSEVLLSRPDIQAAEHALAAANANIGAARAAMFPSIGLTAAGGRASADLSNLVTEGARHWSLAPTAALPIFDFGRRRAEAKAAEIDRDIAVRRYQLSVKEAFQQVADALTVEEVALERISAANWRQESSGEALRIVDRQFSAGVSAYIDVLDAHRTANEASRGLILSMVSRDLNRVTLFVALGNGV